jgi:uncharacterized membrane protein
MPERRSTGVKGPAPRAGVGPRPRLARRQGEQAVAQKAGVTSVPVQPDDPEDPGPTRPVRSIVCLAACLIGVGVSIYVTILHYAKVAPVCSDSGAIDCQKVLTSPQSVFLGIPIPVYGLVFFVGMFVLCLPRLWRTSIWWIPWLRLVGSSVSILFALRLIYEELFAIRSLCLWCTSVHIMAFILFIVIVTGWEDATQNVIPRRA